MVKQDTRLKLSVSAQERFAVTLRTVLKMTAPNSNTGCTKQNIQCLNLTLTQSGECGHTVKHAHCSENSKTLEKPQNCTTRKRQRYKDMALYQPAPLPFIAELTLIVLYRTEPFISSLFGSKKQLVPLQPATDKTPLANVLQYYVQVNISIWLS